MKVIPVSFAELLFPTALIASVARYASFAKNNFSLTKVTAEVVLKSKAVLSATKKGVLVVRKDTILMKICVGDVRNCLSIAKLVTQPFVYSASNSSIYSMIIA